MSSALNVSFKFLLKGAVPKRMNFNSAVLSLDFICFWYVSAVREQHPFLNSFKNLIEREMMALIFLGSVNKGKIRRLL